MDKNINIFNAIETIKALASDNEAIKATLEILEREVAAISADYTIKTGIESVKQQQAARQEVLDFLHYTTAAKTWKDTIVDTKTADSWMSFLAGNLADGTLVDVENKRSSYNEKTTVSVRYNKDFTQPKVTILLFSHWC